MQELSGKLKFKIYQDSLFCRYNASSKFIGHMPTSQLALIQARAMSYAVEGGPSTEQVQMCQDAWKKVIALDPTYKTHTVLLYKNLFAIAPEALQLFSFRDEPDLYNSPKLLKHGKNVIKYMDRAITDLEKFDEKLNALGTRHINYGVVGAHFDVLGQAFLNTLEQALGDDLTPELKEAYGRMWTAIALVVKRNNFEE